MLAEATVDLTDGDLRDDAAVQAARVDPLLDRDVSPRLELEVALAGVLAVVALERQLNVDRMRGMALDEVAVVAVHRTDQVGQRHQQAGGQGAVEPGASLPKLQSQVGQTCAAGGGLA